MKKMNDRLRIFLIFGLFDFLFLSSISLGSYMYRAESFLTKPTGLEVLKMAVWALGLSIPLSAILVFCFRYLSRKQNERQAERRENFWELSVRGFMGSWKGLLCLWILLFGMFLLCYLAYYPGAYAYDIHWQTAQATGYYPYNSHHPPFHTFLWSICIKIGSGEIKKALLVYGVAQMVLLSGALANMVRTLAKSGVKMWLVIGAILFVCLNPVFAIFSFIMTKDVMFGAFFVLFMTSLYRISAGVKMYQGHGDEIILGTEIILCCLFRKNAVMAFAMFAMLSFLLQKQKRRRNFYLFVAPLIFYMLVTGVGYRLLKVESGDMREAFHVPMMQISYTAMSEWEELSPKLKEKVSEFITLEEIKENYDPLFADTIKDHFQISNQMGEKKFIRFSLLYCELLIRYPADYLYSYLHLSWPYWNPFAVTDVRYHHAKFISTDIVLNESLIRESRFPAILALYEKIADYSALKEHGFLLPLFSLSLPLWMILFFGTILWAERRYDRIVLYIPVFLLWLTYALGPVALSRYMLPFMLCYPVLVAVACRRKDH